MIKKRKQNRFNVKLDPEEMEIEAAFPKNWDKLPVTSNLAEELDFAKEAAGHYLRKDTKINIRLSSHDLDGLRRAAVKEGLPYQTLISSVLHKYVSGILHA